MKANLLILFLFVGSLCGQTFKVTPLPKQPPSQAQQIQQLEQRVMTLEAQMAYVQTVNLPWIAWYIQYFKNAFDQVWGKASPDFQFRDKGKDVF